MLVEVPDTVPVPAAAQVALVGPRAAAFLLMAARSARLPEVAARQPPGVRAELLATLAVLERVAQAWRDEQAALQREDAAELSAAAPESWCSVEAASLVVGRSVRRTQELVQGGAIIGRKVGRAWLVDRESAQMWAERDAA